ncbi:MAG TPA: DUF2971 domain-containing protein [Gallionellaceae bacterium]|jgi:hypothetical protein|nr:DUF2971 domain-containing protein [Gallionellaceae bacterium]HQS74604.1 DUF2971 domain-containing protein [Gallionellaceae bacterium]
MQDLTLGTVEAHAHLLSIPSDTQLLYKIISVENLLRSIVGNYLYFNRVDSYIDFPGADHHDGRQLPQDQESNSLSRFEKAPDFSAANYYDQSRARTYACCFSLENSDFIWNNYANGSERGKVCVVFEFGKLRNTLNQILQPGNAVLNYNGNQCHQIFSVNYGTVGYVNRETHQANTQYLPNPIIYTYLKDKEKFSEEKEFRISLSTIGIGQFALSDGSTMQLPLGLELAFDLKAAIADGTIQQILYSSCSDSDFLLAELHKLHIFPSNG